VPAFNLDDGSTGAYYYDVATAAAGNDTTHDFGQFPALPNDQQQYVTVTLKNDVNGTPGSTVYLSTNLMLASVGTKPIAVDYVPSGTNYTAVLMVDGAQAATSAADAVPGGSSVESVLSRHGYENVGNPADLARPTPLPT